MKMCKHARGNEGGQLTVLAFSNDTASAPLNNYIKMSIFGSKNLMFKIG